MTNSERLWQELQRELAGPEPGLPPVDDIELSLVLRRLARLCVGYYARRPTDRQRVWLTLHTAAVAIKDGRFAPPPGQAEADPVDAEPDALEPDPLEALGHAY